MVWLVSNAPFGGCPTNSKFLPLVEDPELVAGTGKDKGGGDPPPLHPLPPGEGKVVVGHSLVFLFVRGVRPERISK